MPIHDWARVPAGIFHAFHHFWISALSGILNNGLLPTNFYALIERQAAEAGPEAPGPQTDEEFYRRKKSSIATRHVKGDRMVAMLEVVSPGNKASGDALRALVQNVSRLLEQRIHLLIVDPFPPGPHDPQGIHKAIWDEVEEQPFELPPDKPLTLVAYVSDLARCAYLDAVAVGDPLPDMPLFLGSDTYVAVPLEATYQTAFASMPRRWRTVLEAPPR